MARFLLIHGSAHGAWCWRDVIPALNALGHEADAIDLPGNGDDTTPPEAVTLNLCAEAILDAVIDPVILVGHSMGGFPITLAAEIAPQSIAHLVYLCAYTPWPGLSLTKMRMRAKTQPLIEAMQVSDDRVWMTFKPDMIEEKFYHDCPPGTLDYAMPRLCRQAIAPSSVSVELTGKSQTMDRSYIICKNDRAIPPDFQREMASRFEPDHVYTLDTAHSPFFADPAGLARILDSIAEKT